MGADRLGYAKIGITLDSDAHMLPGMRDGAVDKLGEMPFREIARRRLAASIVGRGRSRAG